METRPAPPPLILWRAHRFDIPYEVIDENTSDLVRNFASDMHKWNELEGGSEIRMSLPSPQESGLTVMDLADELLSHLRKTQMNQQKLHTRQDRLDTGFVSLSGDLRWTMHYTSQKAKSAPNIDEVGIAAFDSTSLVSEQVDIWRVTDIIEFLESKPGLLRGGLFDRYAKQWAKNADEYVVRDYVPKDSLINFCKWESLSPQINIDKNTFLLKQFVASISLGHFARDYAPLPEVVNLKEYVDRANDFAQTLLGCGLITVDMIRIIALSLSKPSDWGYEICGTYESNEDLLQKIMAEILKDFDSEGAVTPTGTNVIASNAGDHGLPYIIENIGNLDIDNADGCPES